MQASDFNIFRTSSQFCDVCLIFNYEGNITKMIGHKIILAARSPVLKEQFLSNKTKDGGMQNIEINDCDPVVFTSILESIYSQRFPSIEGRDGNKQFSLQFVLKAVKMCYRFQLHALEKHFSDAAMHYVKESNACSILTQAHKLHIKELERHCLSILSSIPVEDLLDLLCDDVEIAEEEGTDMVPPHLVADILMNKKLPSMKTAGSLPLEDAIVLGRKDVIVALFEKNVDPLQRTSDGRLPLQIALESKRMDIIEVLLKHGKGAGVNSKFVSDYDPADSILHASVRADDELEVRILLEGGAHTWEVNSTGQTALHIASANCNMKLLKLLIDYKALPNQQDLMGQTVLHVAGASLRSQHKRSGTHPNKSNNKDLISLVQFLLDDTNFNGRGGADPNITDVNGRHPIQLAALNGSVDICSAMIDSKKSIDVAYRDYNGDNVLHLAARMCNLPCLLFLLSKTERSVCLQLDELGNAKEEAILMINACNLDLNTPLNIAAATGTEKAEVIVKALLEAGANPNIPNCVGRTALHTWCERIRDNVSEFPSVTGLGSLIQDSDCETSLIRTFVECGANVNAQTIEGLTPLHLAIARGKQDDMIELLRNGADLCIFDFGSGGNGWQKPQTPLTALRKGVSTLAIRFHEDISDPSALVNSDADPKKRRAKKQKMQRLPIEPLTLRQRRYLEKNLLNGLIISPKTWMPDNSVLTCMLCSKEFTMRRRRHHCRHCGHIICSTCGSKMISIPKFKVSKKVRVCNACFKILESPTSVLSYSDDGDDAKFEIGSSSFQRKSPPNHGNKMMKEDILDASSPVRFFNASSKETHPKNDIIHSNLANEESILDGKNVLLGESKVSVTSNPFEEPDSMERLDTQNSNPFDSTKNFPFHEDPEDMIEKMMAQKNMDQQSGQFGIRESDRHEVLDVDPEELVANMMNSSRTQNPTLSNPFHESVENFSSNPFDALNDDDNESSSRRQSL